MSTTNGRQAEEWDDIITKVYEVVDENIGRGGAMDLELAAALDVAGSYRVRRR